MESVDMTTLGSVNIAPITLESHPIHVDDIIQHEVDDDLVLYDPRRDAVHILNETAAAVWWLCDGRRTEADIASEIARLYEQDVDVVKSDVVEVVKDLVEKRMLKTDSGSR